MSTTDDQNENNPLNDAVEQNVDDSTGANSSEAEEQNRNTTSTVTSTAASGDTSMADGSDTSQEEGDTGGSSANDSEDSGSSAPASSSDTDSSSGSSDSQSDVIGGVSDSGSDGSSADDSGGDEVGTQAVGGDVVDETSSESQTTTDSSVADTSGASGAVSSEEASSEESFDSETTEESFTVDVVEDSVEVEEFDTTTTEETYSFSVTAVNDGPEVSQDQSLAIDEDTTRIITQDELLAYASDIDNPDDLVAENLSLADDSMGVVVNNGDGTFSFTPAQDFNGEVAFNYDVSDGIDTTSANLSIDVATVNDAAAVDDQAFTVNEDGIILLTDAQLLAGASDVDGDTLSIADVSYSGTDGVLTNNGDGTYSFAPNENFNGDITGGDLSFSVSDGTVSTTANIDISVADVNDAPVAGSTSYSVAEDGTLSFSEDQLLANSSDVDGTVSVQNVAYSGADGVLTNNGDGTYDFAPNENFNGDVAIDVTVVDDDGAVATTTAAVTVTDVNDPPVAGSTSYSVDEDGILTFSDAQLLANSSDVDGTVSVDSVAYSGTDGILTNNGDGTYDFAPNENFNGNVSLDVTVVDDDGATATTTASVDTLAVNDTPVVSGDLAYSVDEDGSITFSQEQLLANTTDVDGDDLTASNLSAGGNATVTDNGDGTFTVVPDEHFNGDIALSFDVSDGAETVAAGVDLTVNPVNDAAIVDTHDVVVNEDATLTFTDEHLLANVADFDDEDTHSIDSVSYSGTDGVFSDNGDGTYSFAPNEHFNGDVELDFVVDDGVETTASTINVDVTAMNDAPIAGSTSFSMNEDGSITLSDAQLLANSSDIDGDVLGVSGVSYTGDSGALVDNGNGSYTFTPNENFNGDVALDISVSDGIDISTTTAQIDVAAVNDLASFPDPTYTIDEDTSLTLTAEDILSNATDIDGDTLTLESVDYTGDDGVLVANEDGTYTFTPTENFNGDLDLSATINDGIESATAVVHVQVDAVNDDAVVEDQAFSVDEDGLLTITDAQLLSGASDIDGDNLSVANVSYTGSDGVFTDNGDGTYSFAPNENFNGDITGGELTFSVSDGTTTTDANIDISVADVNDAPVAGSTSYSIGEDGTLNFSDAQLLANSSDVDGTVSVDSVAYSGTDGVFTDHGDGTYSFAPNENFNGDVSIDVQVIDDNGATAGTTAGVTVEDINDAPVAGSTTYSVDEDGTLTFSDAQLLANSSDVDGTLSVDSVAYSGTDGILTNNGDGTYDFAPNENFNGNVSLDVTVVDDDGATATTTASVDTLAVNDTPVVSDDLAYSVDEDGSITFSQEQLLANASDVDGDTLSATNLSAGGDATVIDNGDGTFTVTPDTDYNGDISLSFDVSDGAATIAAGIDLTVNPVNDTAVVTPTSLSGTEDNTITITQADLLANASDVDGDALVASNLSIDSSFGVVVDNGDGTFSFTPVDDYNGDVPFSFAVSDGTASTTAHGNIDIAAVNDIPVFSEASFATAEDNSIIIDSETLLANASDADGDTLSITSIASADGNGTVTENADGNWVFTPDEHFSGDAQLNITISDGTDTAIFDSTVSVDAVADAPSLNVSLDQVSVTEFSDASISGGRLSGWSTDNESGTIEVNPDYIYGVGDNRGQVLELEAAVGDEANVYQNLDISAGETINLSFDISARVGSSGEDAQVDLYFDGVLIDSIQPGVGWESHSYTLTATSDNPRLELDSPSHNGGGAVLDVITVSEPLGVYEDTVIAVNIDAALVDTDGSESMQSLTVDDIPEGAILSDGNNEFVATIDSNAVDVLDWDLSNLTITPPDDFNGELPLEVTAVSVEASNGDTSSTTQTLSIDVQAANDAVVIDVESPLAFNVTEDVAFTITEAALLANASDIDGDDLIVTSLSIPNASFVTVVDAETGDKSFIVTPNENFNGDVDISFNVSDQEGSVVESGASLSVAAVNDAAVVQDQAFIVNEDGTITITDAQLLSGASDVDTGDTLSIADVSYTGTDGVFTDNGDGTYDFAPNENFNGDITGGDLSFSVSDGTVTTNANIDISVADVNDAPVAGSTSYSVAEDGTLTFSEDQLLANSSDVDGTVSVQDVSYSGADGVLTNNGDGTYDFAPNENFNGDVAIDVTVVDDDGAVATTVAGVTVTDVNDAPVAGSTSYSVDEDGILTISDAQLLANSSDVDGTASVDSVAYGGTDGILTDNGNGTHSFAPNENFNGDVSLDVTVIDDDGATDVTTAGIDVIAMNDTPVVSGDLAYSVDEDGSITFSQAQLLANSSDIDGDSLSATNLSAGGDSTVTDNGDGTFTVTPDADFNGDIQLSFDVSDSDGATAQGGVGLTVNPVNDVAVVQDQAFTLNEDGSITITDAQLLSGASDVDGDTLSVADVSYTGTDGVFTDNGDGTYDFAPNENFNGDISGGDLSFSVSDGTATTDANIDLTITDVNDAPVAGSTTYSVSEDGTLTISDAQLLANSGDVDGTVSVDSVAYSGTDGILTDNGDGTHSFAPNENFNGNVSLDVTVVDDDGATDVTTAGIDVIAMNDVPVVSGDLSYSVNEDGSITFSQEQLLANASDLDGDGLSATNLSAGGDSTVTDNGDGTFTVTPDADYNGDIALSFDVSDGIETVAAGVDLTVNPMNDAAVVHDQAFSTDEDNNIIITDEQLLAGASDIDGDNLSVESVSYTGTDGVLTDNGDGTHTFAPNENFNGDVNLSFAVNDGSTTTNANIDLNVVSVNDAPDAPTVEMVGTEDQVLTIDPAFILAQASDLDGDDLTLTDLSVRAPQGAQLNQQPDGTYQLIAAQDYNGIIELDYTISDGTTTTDGTLNTDIQPVNDAAFATGNAHLAIEEDGAITFNADDMLDLFDDVDGDTVAISRVVLPDDEEGTLTDNGDGTFTYFGADDFAGVPQLELVVTDGTEETTLDLPIYIRPVADGAVITRAQDGPIVMTEDETGLFSFSVGLIDDSESVSNVAITGFPVGFELSDGTNTITITDANQFVDVTGWDTENIAMTPPENWSGTFDVTVSATTIDYGDEQVTDLDASTVASGDFETNVGEPVIITEADLLAMSGLETDENDGVQLVHLADRSQGDLVDNGDGTFTFTPAVGFDGEVPLAYLVVDENGNTTDAQSSIAVLDATSGNAAPTADTEVTTNLAHDCVLNFTDADLLSTVSDTEGDTLSITGVEIAAGDGVVEDHGDGTYTFTPDEGVSGDVAIGFTATDGTSTLQSQFNVAVAEPDAATYNMSEDGSLTLTTAELLDQVGVVDSTATIDDVSVDPEAGTVIDNGDGTYTFWSDPDYNGSATVEISASDNTTSGTGQIAIDIAAVDDAPTVSAAVESDVEESGSQIFTLDELLANVTEVDGDNLTVTNFASDHATMTDNGDGTYTLAAEADYEGEIIMTYDVSDGTSTVEASITADTRPDAVADGIDAYAAPGGAVTVNVPTDISADTNVDSILVSGIPDGATLSSGLDNGDGTYTLSGDLSQPVTLNLGDSFEGQAVLEMQGVDQLNNPIDGSSATTSVEVSSDYALDGSSADNAEAIDDTIVQDDWTTASTDTGGVDPLADTGTDDGLDNGSGSSTEPDPNDFI